MSAATVTAADLGRAAHAAGRMRSPGADAELMRVESEQPTSAAKCAASATSDLPEPVGVLSNTLEPAKIEK